MAVWIKRSGLYHTAGAGSVDTGANMFDSEFATGAGEVMSIEARAIIGHDAAHDDAEAGEVGHGLTKELAGRGSLFIRQHGGEGDAGVVIDVDIEKLCPAPVVSIMARIPSDAVAWLNDAGQLFDVDVQQIAGSGYVTARWVSEAPSISDLSPVQARVRMRLTVARLSLVAWAIRTPVQRSRRSRSTCSSKAGATLRGAMGTRGAVPASPLLPPRGSAVPTWQRSAG